jgi:CBS-domain-containing membrane protein
MHTARVKRLPVVDERGQLLGIVSRADLLRVFTRPDEAIRSEIINDVIVGDLMNPSRFVIRVDDGVVVLEGEAERSSLIPYLVRAVHQVEGVVRVENKLSFDVDDYDPAMAYPWMAREPRGNENLPPPVTRRRP